VVIVLVLSKLFKLLVARQLRDYLTSADLLPPLQSSFRPGHSTETAVLQVLSDVLQVLDRGNSAALVLLNLSAAFDTVDHEILLQRLRVNYFRHPRHSSPVVSVVAYLLGQTYSMYGAGLSNHP